MLPDADIGTLAVNILFEYFRVLMNQPWRCTGGRITEYDLKIMFLKDLEGFVKPIFQLPSSIPHLERSVQGASLPDNMRFLL